MKRLFIVRHGKSDWDFQSVKDIDRTLKERGISDGYKMARRLLEKELIPDIIISSDAIRALHSAVIFRRVLGLPPAALTINHELYLAGVERILSILYAIDNRINAVMIFGHNPGFSELAHNLSNLSIPDIPTTGMVILDFDTNNWSEITKHLLSNEVFDSPGKS